MDIPNNVKKKRLTEAYPLPTSTVIGCAIAVNRKVFFELGAFDEDVPSVWGGENIELPWRYWMCADGVQTIPSSRVGHLWRSRLPYDILESSEKNYQRAAEIWMGEYRKFYYASVHARSPCPKQNWKALKTESALYRISNAIISNGILIPCYQIYSFHGQMLPCRGKLRTSHRECVCWLTRRARLITHIVANRIEGRISITQTIGACFPVEATAYFLGLTMALWRWVSVQQRPPRANSGTLLWILTKRYAIPSRRNLWNIISVFLFE